MIKQVLVCMPSVSVCSCSQLLFGNSGLEYHQKVNYSNVDVERGVATRRAQMVWPVITVTVTTFEGFTRQQF